MRVFVSSTSKDLYEYRKAVLTGINRLGHVPVAMEYFTAEDIPAVAKCLQAVAECDLYVGIFAKRYGYIPKGYDCSISELEYKEAVAKKIPTLTFLLDDRVKWPDEFVDHGGQGERMEVFCKKLQEKIVNFFQNPDDLCAKVTAAIARTMTMQEAWQIASTPTRETISHWKQEINYIKRGQAEADQRRREATREFIAGPFSNTVVQFFKDREKEITWLRQQLADEHVRLNLICGRGGVGKSALIAKLLSDLQSNPVIVDNSKAESLVDGVAYVSLRQPQYRSPDKIVELIGRVIEPVASRELQERWREESPLSDKLREKRGITS